MARLGIFIFRRDLRLYDNIALYELQKNVDVILPIFILNEEQIIKNNKNKYYFSNNAVQFICESLIDLNNQLIKYGSKLYLFLGNPNKIITKLINKIKPSYIGYNADFSARAIKRDNYIDKLAMDNNITIINSYDDLILTPLIDKPYKQFSAFYKMSKLSKVNNPLRMNHNKFIKHSNIKYFEIEHLNKFYVSNPNLAQHGGRRECLNKLNNLRKFKISRW